MNIFELYLDKIKESLLHLSKKEGLILPETFDGITTEVPPPKFNSDISTNVAMVLSKINKKNPIDLMIRDLLTNTQKNLKELKIKSVKEVAKSDKLIVSFSDKFEKYK